MASVQSKSEKKIKYSLAIVVSH